MTVLVAAIAFVLALITVISVLAHEKDIADEGKSLHLKKINKKNNLN